jgi:Fic family protein
MAAMFAGTHQFEPLFPVRDLDVLRAQSHEIVRASIRLSSLAHDSVRAEMRELVRGMNSYYSNRIEGQGTHPRNIERALALDFSDKPKVARLQRLAIAHIEAEHELEATRSTRMAPGVFVDLGTGTMIEAHRALYARLPADERVTEDGVVIEPGVLRCVNVSVGRHVPPDFSSVAQFLARLDAVFGKPFLLDDIPIAIACLHHRLAWVHPFADGNGRAVRLHSHVALSDFSTGLWSPNRGLARRRDEYYARLAQADAPRQGDLDGRGNLSERGLKSWVEFFLGVCLDQVRFMETMFDLNSMKRRIEALITFRAAQDKALRSQAIMPLHHLFAAGPVTRGEFQQMTGLGQRLARTLLSRLLAIGLVKSDGPYAPVRFALPLDALQFLFPDLYPEAATRVPADE